MSSVTFSSFTLETAPAVTDFLVGYRTAVAGGERRLTITSLSTALATIMPSSIAGTANQITASDSTGAVTLSLAGPHNFTSLTSTAVLLGGGTSAINASDMTYSTPALTVPDAFNVSSAGSISLTAGGTNKNITLTPSGTGATVVGGNLRMGSAAINSTAGKILTMLSPNSGSGYSEIEAYGFDTTKGGQISLGGGSNFFASIVGLADTSPGGQMVFRTANASGVTTTALTISTAQRLTTAADLFVATNAAIGNTLDPLSLGGRHLSVVASSGFSFFDLYGSGSTNGGQIDIGSGTIRWAQIVGSRDSSGNQGLITMRVNGGGSATSLSDALTIDHNLLTTLKGNLAVGASTSTITGAAGNMTITAGTGNSRTLTLQTTTSGGTATNALVLGATQSATFNGPIIQKVSALTYASPTSVDVTLANVYTVTTVNATGSVTFNASAGGTSGQKMTIIITNDATSAKTITFGTNFKTTGTLTASAASRQTTISFVSDGTNFCETARAVLTS